MAAVLPMINRAQVEVFNMLRNKTQPIFMLNK